MADARTRDGLPDRPLLRIVSGGQTGVDRAALDVALALGLAHGGWCPAGRGAEDGPIDARYALTETPSAQPEQRTEWNVRDSDATLILAPEPLTGGTRLTVDIVRRLGKPHLVVDPFAAGAAAAVSAWLRRTRASRVPMADPPVRAEPASRGMPATAVSERGLLTLDIAGPRESHAPGIHAAAVRLLLEILSPLVALR